MKNHTRLTSTSRVPADDADWALSHLLGQQLVLNPAEPEHQTLPGLNLNPFHAYSAETPEEAVSYGPYSAGRHAVAIDSLRLLKHAVLRMGADPNRLVMIESTGAIEYSLLGMAIRKGRTALVKWMLREGGADANAFASWTYDDEELQLGKDTHATPLEVALRASYEFPASFCPQRILMSLIRPGANTNTLIQRMLNAYRCEEHGNECGLDVMTFVLTNRPAVEEEEDGNDPARKRDYTACGAAIAFLLTRTQEPVRALPAMLDVVPAPSTTANHPLVVCVKMAMVLGGAGKWLVNAFLLILWYNMHNGRLEEIVSLEEVVADVLWHLARWRVDGDPEKVEQRWQLLRLALNTGVHPDTAPRNEAPPIMAEIWNLIQDADPDPDVRFLEELLWRGADVRKPWRDEEGKEFTPLELAENQVPDAVFDLFDEY